MDEITYMDVKKKLVNHYTNGWGGDKDSNEKRKLNVYKDKNNDSIILSLEGSPPKGYCIAAGGCVNLYDLNGKRFKIIIDTYLVEN